jgi:hypothetical protein
LVDFAFAGQRSKNKDTAIVFVGYGGKTCCILLTDNHTEKLYGTTQISKVPPVAWLRRFFCQHIPELDPKDDQYKFLDQVGELCLCVATRDILEKEFFFQLHPTGTEAHHQNGLIE